MTKADLIFINKKVQKMNQALKIAVLSGQRLDQGKTAIVDNLIAPRLNNLVRIEIESASTGSSKPNVTRIPATKLPLLRQALLTLDEDDSLVCDVGGSEYSAFMHEVTQYRSTTAEFDRFLFVMRAGGGIKEADAMDSIIELLGMGVAPEKVSVIFNYAPYVVGLPALRENLRAQFGNVFSKAAKAGFHVCATPLINADPLYKIVFHSPTLTIDSLANGADYRAEMKALKKSGKEIPESLYVLESAQENARSFGKANLDAVWSEIMAASAEVEA